MIEVKSGDTIAVKNLKRTVKQGIRLIESDPDGAYRLFNNHQKAQEAGLKLSPGNVVQIDTSKPMNHEEIRHFANEFARGMREQSGIITIPTFIPTGIGFEALRNPLNLPLELRYHMALIGAEEWLHGLQELADTTVGGYLNAEIDVAAALLREGARVDEIFMSRYYRNLVLQGDPNNLASEIFSLSLRIGSFVRIPGETTETPHLWQISEAHPKTRQAFVRKGIVTQPVQFSELTQHNHRPVPSPFSKCTSLTELYSLLTELGGVQGSDKYFEALKLKQLINELKEGKCTINHITSSGGLRQKVLELL